MIEVAIVGAGPYGLSIAAYLQHLGCSYRVFGQPMLTWRNMPEGISLKSPSLTTNIGTPRPNFLFTQWCRERGLEDFEPCSMANFAAYGVWVQEQLVSHVDLAEVTAVTKHGNAFLLQLDNGSTCSARNVVVATGLSKFETMPAKLEALGEQHVTHTARHHHYRDFRGLDVAVIGAGASAIEASAMIHEAGGNPVQIVRENRVLIFAPNSRTRPLKVRLKTPYSAIGPGWKSLAYSTLPTVVHSLPEARRVRLDRLFFGPSGPWWIKDRFEGIVPVELNSQVADASVQGDKVVLSVETSSGQKHELRVDRVVAGTGYTIDTAKLEFLSPDLITNIAQVLRAPKLSKNFESSVTGLYFAGPCAALSFGPLLRFVAGADFAAKTIARHLSSSDRKKVKAA